MTDDLRTRIAAVLRGYLLDHFIVDSEQAQGLWPEYLADAVIRYLDSHGWLIDPQSGDRARLARPSKPPLFGQHPAIGDHGPIMLNISQKETDE